MLLRKTVLAKDGPVGSPIDIYIDERDWKLRYLILETGTWLRGRRVLLSPCTVEMGDWYQPHLQTSLTYDQLAGSPEVHSEKPVSWHCEERLVEYFGWPAYWLGDVGAGVAVSELDCDEKRAITAEIETRTRLRSYSEIRNYSISGTGSSVGAVEDFFIRPHDWSIEYLVINHGTWFGSRVALVDPQRIESIDWASGTIRITDS